LNGNRTPLEHPLNNARSIAHQPRNSGTPKPRNAGTLPRPFNPCSISVQPPFNRRTPETRNPKPPRAPLRDGRGTDFGLNPDRVRNPVFNPLVADRTRTTTRQSCNPVPQTVQTRPCDRQCRRHKDASAAPCVRALVARLGDIRRQTHARSATVLNRSPFGRCPACVRLTLRCVLRLLPVELAARVVLADRMAHPIDVDSNGQRVQIDVEPRVAAELHVEHQLLRAVERPLRQRGIRAWIAERLLAIDGKYDCVGGDFRSIDVVCAGIERGLAVLRRGFSCFPRSQLDNIYVCKSTNPKTPACRFAYKYVIILTNDALGSY